jgi:Regulator of chromosome condensation (RCC1) repeat
MLALGGRARRGVHTVITVTAVAAGQSVGPGPTAVFSWGWNQHGEVGDGTTNHRATPGPVLGLPSVHGWQVAVKQLASGRDPPSTMTSTGPRSRTCMTPVPTAKSNVNQRV